MEGKLDKLENEWLIRYVKNNDIVYYDLCDESKKWANKDNIAKILNIDDQVDTDAMDIDDANIISENKNILMNVVSGFPNVFPVKPLENNGLWSTIHDTVMHDDSSLLIVDLRNEISNFFEQKSYMLSTRHNNQSSN